MKILIKGAFYKTRTFPDLNDLLHEAQRHPMAYAQMKKQYQFIACNQIRLSLKGWKAKGKIELNYHFYEPIKGRKRDLDNIASAVRKIVNDALVQVGTIKDDSPEYLGFGSNTFDYTDGTPYIEIEIVELENAPFSEPKKNNG